MTVKIKWVLFLFFALGLFSAQAQALKVGVLGGLGSTSVSVTPTTATLEGQQTFGYGVLVEMDVIPLFAVEVDVLLMSRKWKANLQEYSYPNVFVPVLLRFNALPILTVGAGAYYSFASGDLEIKTGSGVTTLDLKTAGYEKSSFGLLGAVGVTVPVAPLIGVGLDFRYLMSVTNGADGSGTDLNYKEIHLLARLQFQL